jgi:hypothetical protein
MISSRLRMFALLDFIYQLTMEIVGSISTEPQRSEDEYERMEKQSHPNARGIPLWYLSRAWLETSPELRNRDPSQ